MGIIFRATWRIHTVEGLGRAESFQGQVLGECGGVLVGAGVARRGVGALAPPWVLSNSGFKQTWLNYPVCIQGAWFMLFLERQFWLQRVENSNDHKRLGRDKMILQGGS